MTPHPASQRYRALFISDLHLYSVGCRYEQINRFLKHKHFEYIYLIGDIVDFWHLNPRSLRAIRSCPPAADELLEEDRPLASGSEKAINIIRRILKRSQHDGTKIVYIPGNHDDFFRNFVGLEMFGVSIQNHVLHTAADGKEYLLLHGDIFDVIVRYHRQLAMFSTMAYNYGEWLNKCLNWVRGVFGLRPWSLAKAIKSRVDGAVSKSNDFEAELIGAAKLRKVDGVICGHSHIPKLETVDGVTFGNCGDWVEHCTALVEDYNGRIALVEYEDAVAEPTAQRSRPLHSHSVLKPT